MSNRRKSRPVRVEKYPGPPPLMVSAGRPPEGSFGDPPEGSIDIHAPRGCRDASPPAVLVSHALRTRCPHCGKSPGALVLTVCGGTWYVVTKHDPSCPESSERRGRHESLSAILNQPESLS